MGEILYPDADIEVANWTASSGCDRFAMLDEVTPSDCDYVSAPAVPDGCQCCEYLKLSMTVPCTEPSDPTATHTLRVRARHAFGGCCVQGSIDMRVTTNGGCSFYMNAFDDITDSFSERANTFSMNACADYCMVEVWLGPVDGGCCCCNEIEVSSVRLELPDEGGGGGSLAVPAQRSARKSILAM